MQTPAPARSSDAVVTFSDVRSAFTALESSLRDLPNSHRLRCEGNLMMVSPAFVCYSNFRAFCEREGVEYLSSRLCDVMEHLHAALRESSRHELQGSSGQLRSPLHSPLSPLPPLSPLSPLSANGFGPAFTSATMLCVLGDKIARYGRSPPA
ncbi:hypothetical protein JCM24511_09451 [Saitozyma sp. JCM 24511]|nr:hypothetical protein JCM24511_09451 [Saitozyma sp. JCM 24511]